MSYTSRASQRKNNMMTMKVLVVLLAAFGPITFATVAQGGCNCAVFQDNVTEPLIVQSLQYNVTCDQDGSDTCEQLCVALAKGAKDKAPEMICAKLNQHVDNLIASVYTKSCLDENWKFTGLKTPDPICCHAGKESICSGSD